MKKSYLKWILAALGWASGGPIGAILGYAVGSMISSTEVVTTEQANQRSRTYRQTTSQDFMASLLVLSAAVMKADGKVLKSELEYVKQFLTRQFGPEQARQQILLLRDILKQPLPLRKVCIQIRMNMQHPMRLQLIHYLFGLAQADGVLHETEVNVIEKIAFDMGISQKDFISIRAMFKTDTGSAYQILEINESATEQEIKAAYRKMARKYHPDKLSTLSPEIQKAAQEKFIKVQEAYETIKKERNIK